MKFELTLTRRAKAHSSSCSQTVSLDSKNQQKTFILEVPGFSKYYWKARY